MKADEKIKEEARKARKDKKDKKGKQKVRSKSRSKSPRRK
jgi:hypothetical protein